MKFLKKPYVWAVSSGLLLTASSAYILLDAFVIPHGQVVLETSTSSTTSTTNLSTGQVSTSDTSYSDDNMSISIETLRQYDTNIYVVDIQLSDPSLLKTAFAQDTFGRNVTATTSDIASSKNAILAINGDFYGFRDDGAVLRNGQLYRTTTRTGTITDALVIDNEGTFSIIDETTTDVSSLDTSNISQIFSFGPTLVNNGVSVVDSSSEVSQSKGSSNPRTAIGMVEAGHYYIVVADGRSSESTGLTLQQLAQVYEDLGVEVAYNLDGGGSSTLYFNGQVINNPTTNGDTVSEREVSDIVYFGY